MICESEFIIECTGNGANETASFNLARQIESERTVQQRLQVMLDSSPLCTFIMDESFNVVECNQVAVSLFEFNDKQHFIKSVFEIASQFDNENLHSGGTMVLAKLQEAFSTGYSQFEWTARTLSQKPIPTEFTVVRVKLEEKNFVIIYVRDMTDVYKYKEAERVAQTRLQMMLDSSPLLCSIFDKNANALEVNQAGVDFFGLSDKQEYLDNFIKFSPEYQPNGEKSYDIILRDTKNVIASGEKFVHSPWMYEMKDGSQVPCEVTLVPVKLSGENRIIVHARDLRDYYKLLEIQDADRLKLQTMLDSSPIACCVTDEKFNVLDCNQVTLDLFELNEKQEYFDNFYKLSPMHQPDGTLSKTKMTEVVKESFASGHAQFEWMHCTLSGTLIPCEVTLKWVTLNGKTARMGYMRDLREQKEMTAQLEGALKTLKNREKLLSVVNKVAAMLLAIDGEGGLESVVMKSMEAIGMCLGADRANLHRVVLDSEGANITMLYEWNSELGMKAPQVDMNQQIPFGVLDGFGRMLLNGEYFNGPVSDLPPAEQSFLNPYNALKSVVIIPLLYEEQPWGIFSIDDCETERTFADEEMDILRSASLMIASAYRRVAQAAEMHRIEIAEESNKAKSRFLARMSHEIRTPATAVMGISEIELQNPTLRPQTQEAFAKIHNSSILLLGIINDILDHSKIEAGKMAIAQAKYDVASLISDAAHLYLSYLDNKDVKFNVQVDEMLPSSLVGDVFRIEQITSNLLSNAFKYTMTGMIELSFQLQEEQEIDGYVSLIITIRDTGLGMTPEQLEYLYNEYERFHMHELHSVTGTGLGMSIVYGLVQMMDGHIKIKSEVGKGTTVVVRLPQKIANNEVLGKEMASNLQRFDEYTHVAAKGFSFVPESMPYGKVLVVDDTDANLYVAKGLLAFYDLDVETCVNGQEAIDKIKQGKVYDLVLLDHMMPGLDGMETMRILRDMGYTQPIVALTANAIIGQAEKFIASGFDGFISKPIQTKLLNTVLIKHIKDKQSPEVINAAKANQTLKDTPANPANMDEYLNSESLREQLRQDFVRSQKNAFSNLRNALDEGDTKTANRISHTLKSTAMLIGENDLSKVAASIECSFEENIIPQNDLLHILECELTRVLDDIGEPEAAQLPANQTLDKVQSASLFAELEPLLKSRNIDSLNFTDELSAIPETAVLVRQIKNMDFADALKTLCILKDILGC